MELEGAEAQVDTGPILLDIDGVHMVLHVEQEQIQKRTFTNWINAQLAKRKPPRVVHDLFKDCRDGSLLLDLLEVMTGQHMSRERGRGLFQHRSNIESALSFLRRKSIKLVNINIPDIIDGKPSIILGLIWTIILHFHIEELAIGLSFSSRQSSMESLASLDTGSISSSGRSSSRSSPMPRRGSPLHQRFRISAKKALMLWVREQLHKAGCSLSVKDFKTSWRSGVVFLAVLCGLRPDLVDLSKAENRSNKQNLEEAFCIAEKELRIPRLLEPEDVDVRDPDEKSIMTYVAQFLQYSQDTPSEEDMQVHYLTPPQSVSPVNLPSHYTPAISASPFRQTSANQKVREVTCWLVQAYQELTEGWDSTEGESYAERYHVFQTFVVSFNEQRRPVMPLLTAMRRTPQLSLEQCALREAWDSLAEKLRLYRTELDLSLPSPLDKVGRWLQRVEGALTDEEKNTQDHARAAVSAREKLKLLKSSMEQMNYHLKIFNSFMNVDEFGAILVPVEKMDEIKRRFTSARVTAKYHGIKLEYQEQRHTTLDLLSQLNNRLCSCKRPYCSQEGIRVLLQDWQETVDKQHLVTLLEAAVQKLKQVAGKYTSKSALAGDSPEIAKQVKDLEAQSATCLEAASEVKGTMGRVLAAWDSYSDYLSSLQAWLAQESQSHSHREEVTAECMSKWSSLQAQLNEVGDFLTEVTSPQTSRALGDEMRRVNLHWADFVRSKLFPGDSQPSSSPHSPQAVQALCREASQLLKDPVEALPGPLRTYEKRLQFMMMKIKDVDVDSLARFPECSAETSQKLRNTLPEVMKTLQGTEQLCKELQQSVSSLETRLAELQHCETEAKELYQLLKDEREYGQNQDPRARMFISRALQLEGQVVTEEQDLQVMVMTAQKNSSLQYLIATAMQEKVRRAVANSQEAVGMLSSLGARRVRSPAEDQPPQKIFIESYKANVPQAQDDIKFHSASHTPIMITKTQYLPEHQDMPEPHAPEAPLPVELPRAPDQSEAPVQCQILTQSQPLTMVYPQPSFDSQKQIQARGPTQPGVLAEFQDRPQHQAQLEVHSQSQSQVKSQLTPHISVHHHSEPQTPLQTVTYAQAVTGSLPLPQSRLQPQAETSHQAYTAVHTPVLAQVAFEPQSCAEDLVQPDSEAPQPHVTAQGKTRHKPKVKPRVITQSSDQRPPLDAPVHDNHLETSAQSQAQKPRSRAKTRPWVQKNEQTPISTQTIVVTEAKMRQQPLVHAQTHFQAHTKAHFQVPTVVQVKVQPQPQVQIQPQAHVQAYSQVQSQLSTPVKTQPQSSVQVHHQPHIPVQSQIQLHTQPHTQVPAAAQVKVQPQPLLQVKTKARVQATSQVQTHPNAHVQVHPKAQVQTQTQSKAQAYSTTKIEAHPPVHVLVQPQAPVSAQTQVHAWAQLKTPQTEVQVIPKVQVQTEVQAEIQNQTRGITQNQVQLHPQMQATIQPQPGVLTITQGLPQIYSSTETGIQTQQWTNAPAETRIETHAQTQPQPVTQIQAKPQIQPQPVAKIQAQSQIQPQPVAQIQAKPKIQPQPVAKSQEQSQIQPHPVTQIQAKHKIQPQPVTQIKAKSEMQTHPQTGTAVPTQPRQLSQSKVDTQIQLKPWANNEIKTFPQTYPPSHREIQPQLWAQTQDQAQPQAKTQIQIQVQAQPLTQVGVQPLGQHPAQVLQRDLPSAQTQSQVQTEVKPQPSAKSKPELLHQVPSETKTQVQTQQQAQDHSQPQSVTLSRPKAPALAQAPPQAYTEAYIKAQALARDRFEEAKHCLQDHILEAITVFHDTQISEKGMGKKEDSLKALDPELLEEFLRAAEGMEAFCTTAQLRDLEFFRESVRTQWEKCFPAKGSLVAAEQRLQALKELCDTLSPEDAHRLAQSQLQECETRLAAIQRQFSGDPEPLPLGDSGQPEELAKDRAEHGETVMFSEALHDKPSPQVTHVIVGANTVEVKKVEKIVIEDQTAKQEVLSRYRDSKNALQAQLDKTNQNLQSFPTNVFTPADFHTKLQDMEAFQKEAERLWSQFELQSTHCCKYKGEEPQLVQDKTELMQVWQRQQIYLQRRIKSLRAATELIDPREKQICQISERLDNYITTAKDITAFSLTDPHCLQDIKDLEEKLQQEMDRLTHLAREDSPALAELEAEDRLLLSLMAQGSQQTLEQLRQQVKKSEAAMRALDRFLLSLRTVEQDVGGTRAAPCEDREALRDLRSRLAHTRQSVRSMADKAPQLDRLLEGAGLHVTRAGAAASCLDMVDALGERLEEVDGGLARQQESLQREQEMRSWGLRRRTLQGALAELQEAAERQGLKEPTMPAVQQRMRALTDVENRLTAHRTELLSLQSAAQEGNRSLEELESQWEDTQRALTERLEQSRVLMDLLKKFQSCRSRLSNTLQRAEQTIGEQASYMGKDNLQRLISTVEGIKEDLAGLGKGVEEIQGVCRQLQSQLKRIPECAEAPFESEADALVDRWLDVTEKTESFMDNLHVGLEMWDKLHLLGGEVDDWVDRKMPIFAEKHPFQSEDEVIALQDEIEAQEKNIQHFHRKSSEIQRLIQSKEPPLDLQVMETQLRKKMEQVKELFADNNEVFQELMGVRRHIAEQISECQSSLQGIESAMNMLSASENPQLLRQIQDLSSRLQSEAEQADSLLKEVSLMANVASPHALEALAAEGASLKENVRRAQELLAQRKKQVERGLVLRATKDQCQFFEEWFQDLQLSVNECFENPEKREDVETSLERLTRFLELMQGEKRLGQLRVRVAEAGEEFPSKQLEPLRAWLREQEKDLAKFRAHCQDRHSHLETCLRTLDSLKESCQQANSWLQAREHKQVQGDELNQLHEEVLKESEPMEGLNSLVVAVRRLGLRSDRLVGESDDLLQRYHSLEARLCSQSEVQSALAREIQAFETQVESTRAWMGDLQDQALSLEKGTVGTLVEIEDRLQKAQALLRTRYDGESKLQDLRWSAQRLSQRKDLEESRRRGVLRAVGDAEELWRGVMQSAEEVQRKAEAQSTLLKETQAFEAQVESTRAWIGDLHQRSLSLSKRTLGTLAEIEDQLHKVQALLSTRFEGDSRLQDLSLTGQKLSHLSNLDESRRKEVLKAVGDAEEQWRGIMQAAEELQRQAEAQSAVLKEIQEFEAQAESTGAWIGDVEQRVHSLGEGTFETLAETEDQLQKVQALLSTRFEGESKLQELRHSAHRLSQLKELEGSRKKGVLKAVGDAEEQWRGVMQSAQELQQQAEAKSVLLKETQLFETQTESTRAWIGDLQQRVLSLDKGTVGTLAEIEGRLQKVQALLGTQSEGESKLRDLKQNARKLSQKKMMDENRKRVVLQAVSNAEVLWGGVLHSAEELCRMLEGLVERLMSCLIQKQQAQERVEQLQRQTPDVPRKFPWPGLGDRRLALENVRSLLNRIRAQSPALSDLQAQGNELFQLTQDPSWMDPSWGALEEHLPPLVKDLTEASGSLEEGIEIERQCAQLVEQHSAALNWLWEQVQVLGAPPSDRAGLQSIINTLKALLQTADREEKDMKELDSVKSSLLPLCTLAGQASLQQEVGRMHELRTSSEQEVRSRLSESEARLQDLDDRQTRRSQELREEAGRVRGDLRKLSVRMDYRKRPTDIGLLQDRWNTLKSCEGPLEELGVRVWSLQQALGSEVTDETLPGDVLTDVASVEQQYRRLRTRLSETLLSCTQDAEPTLRDHLRALQQWNEAAHSQPPTTSTSITQALLEKGERLKCALQGALSHDRFLKDSVGQEQMEKLGRDCADALTDSEVHISNLAQTLQMRGEVESVRLQTGGTPHVEGEEASIRKDASVSLPEPADVSSPLKERSDQEVQTGPQPGTLRKPDESAQPGVQQKKVFMTEEKTLGTLRTTLEPTERFDNHIPDNRVQKSQPQATATQQAGPPPFEHTGTLSGTGNTDTLSNEPHHSLALPHKSTKTTVMDQCGFGAQSSGMPSPDKTEIDAFPTRKQDGSLSCTKMMESQKHVFKSIDAKLPAVPGTSVDMEQRENKQTLQPKKMASVFPDADTQDVQIPEPCQYEGSEAQFSKSSEITKLDAKLTPNEAADAKTHPPAFTEHEERIPVDTVKYTHSPSSSTAPLKTAQDSTMQSGDDKKLSEERSSLVHYLRAVLDAESQKKEEPQAMQIPPAEQEAEKIIQDEIKLAEHPQGQTTVSKQIQSSKILSSQEIQKTQGQNVLLDLPETVQVRRVAAEENGAPPLEIHGNVNQTKSSQVEVNEPIQQVKEKSTGTAQLERKESPRVIQLEREQSAGMKPSDSTHLEERTIYSSEYHRPISETKVDSTTETLKREKSLTDKIHTVKKEAKTFVQDEPALSRLKEPPQIGAAEPLQSRNKDNCLGLEAEEVQKRFILLDLPVVTMVQEVTSQKPKDEAMRIQDHVEQPNGSQEEFVEWTQIERVKHTGTAQPGQTKSTGITPSDISQFEGEVSHGLMPKDTAQREESSLETLEAHRLEFETTVNRIVESQKKDDPDYKLVQPAEQNDAKTIPDEPTLTKYTEKIQVQATDNRKIRRRGQHSGPDSLEIQKRYLVLDLPEVADVQIVTSQPEDVAMEIQEHVEQPKGPQVEFAEWTMLEKGKKKVVPAGKAQLEQKESTSVIPADISQLEGEVSPGVMPKDTAQLEENRPGAPEAHRLEIETSVNRTVESQKDDSHEKLVQPAQQKNAKTIKKEPTLTKHTEHLQAHATDSWHIRGTGPLSSPDSLEIQKRYLVLDFTELADVQTVTSQKPREVVMEIQGHAEQPKGPQEEFAEWIQQKKKKEMPTDKAQLEQTESATVMPADVAQLEGEVSHAVMAKGTAQPEERGLKTPETHRLEFESTVNRAVESQKKDDSHYKLVQLAEQKDGKTIQDEPTLTKQTDQICSQATDNWQIRNTGQLSSLDCLEIQKRYLVLDLPEVAEVQMVIDTPHDTPIGVQECVDQLKESQTELSVPIQLERDESTDTALLKEEDRSTIMPSDKAVQDKEEHVRMTHSDAAQPEEEKDVTTEACQPVSKSEMVEATLSEYGAVQDRAEPQTSLAKAEHHQADILKDLLPDSRETATQGTDKVKENTESATPPLISAVQAEPGLGRATVTEPSDSSESRKQDIVKSSQSKEETPLELPALSQPNKKVSEEEETSGPEDVTGEEELLPKLSLGPTMQGAFSEIQQLVEGGPCNFVVGGKPLWVPVGNLDTSRRDLENRLSHVIFRVLNCKNRPAQFGPTAMTQQVEEAEDCRFSTQEQLAAFSQMRESEGWNSEAAEGHWSVALSEASAVLQAKEAQLQQVMQYHMQTLAAKAIQEKLEAELEALKLAPVESSSVKSEKLRAVLSDLEQERTVIGKLLQMHAELSPYLGQSDRLVAITQLEQLQNEWRDLERAAEKALHQVSVLIRESGDLLQECQELQDQLEGLRESLGPPQPSSEEWNSQRAGELMAIGSALTAASHHYLLLQPQTSDALFRRFQGEKEKKEVEQALQHVKERVGCLQGQIAQQAPSSSNITLGKIMKVMQEAFTWAKHTEKDIEASKKVALLPEGVHSQIKGLKKLQSEIFAKQSQLESFVEEVRELIPDLDEKDTPMVLSSLQTLEDMSKSTAGKLARALKDMELCLQTREKMSEQIADVDSWVMAHVHKEVVREAISKGSTADLERKLRQLQGVLKEADKQAAVTEALLMRSKDIAPELTMVENCRLNEKLISLQEDIKCIMNCEKAKCQELEELLQAQTSSRKKLASLELSLRQMLLDLNKFSFPITRDSLCSIQPMKQMIIQQKCEVEQLPHCSEEKRNELLLTIAELQNKVNTLGRKAELHERYFNCWQRIEKLKYKVEAQLLKVKDRSIDKEERFKNGQALLVQFPLIKDLCKVAEVELQNISTDLYPSELSSERCRIKQAAESFSTWELTATNDVDILERTQQSSLHYPTEQYTMLQFLKHAHWELEQPHSELEQQTIDRELLKCAILQRNVQCRARVLEALEKRNESRGRQQEQKKANLADLKRKTLSACALRMEHLSQVQEMLRKYCRAVSDAVRFLQEAESKLLVPVDYAGTCPEELQRVQQALALLDEKFQSDVTQIQTLVPQHSCLSSKQAEHVHSTVLSQLIVRMAKLQAQAQLRMEALQKCSKKQKIFRKSLKEISPRLKTVEASLLDCIAHSAISYKACLDHQEKLKALGLEVDYLAGRLQDLREWCPEYGCSRSREAAVNSLRREWARLHHCIRYLKARSVKKGVEWRDIIKSVERATAILDQLQAELPECSGEKATQEELHDALLYTEQYQDRLDCEQRSLTALELRAARLLGVPAHQELSPPIPLCQELQTMQRQYKELKEKGMQGRRAVQSEVQEREKVKEEIGGVREWLMAALSVLSVVEELPSTQELQEVQAQLCSQKAVLQDIMEGLRMKYSDMYTLVPVEIDGPLQEVNHSLQEVEEKVGEAVEKSGPLCRLGAKVEEIRVGLQVVLASLEKRSPSVAEAESRQKRVWDDLDRWHSRIAALEVEVHDIADENPEAAHVLTDKLMETLQLYQHVAKQAEQRTAFLSKIHTCLQEHEEMISSSNSWLMEAHSWLTTPCTYTTAKCLSSHVKALQMVLDDSEQMRRTLQNFMLVLREVSSVCDMTTQEDQQVQADQRVATMQQSIIGQLSQFRHATEEVEAIESEVEKMERNLKKFSDVLSSQDTTSPPSEYRLRDMKKILTDMKSMKRTIAEIQSCKPGLGLPEEAEESLIIFNRAEQLLQQIESLGQTISERDPTLKVAVEQLDEVEDQSTFTAEEVIVPSPTLSVIEELQESDIELGHIEIAHLEDDVLKRAGASLMTVLESSPEQRQRWGSEGTTQDPDEIFIGEEQTGTSEASLKQSVGGDETVSKPQLDSSAQDTDGSSLPVETQESEDPLKPVVPVKAQAFPQSMVNKSSSVDPTSTSPKAEQKCTVS